MNKKQLLVAAIAIITTSAIVIACTKGTSIQTSSTASGSKQNVSLYLTDGPGIFDNVYLDVKSIEILVDTSKNTRVHDSCNWQGIGSRLAPPPDSTSLVWSTLSFNAGIYDLLQLRNGVDTLLSTSTIPAGSVRLIRIDLGTNNSIVVDSVSHSLLLPPGAPSYFIIQLKGNEWQRFAANSYRLWLDFDVARSVIFYNSNYYLAPVLRNFIPNQTGLIEGSVSPRAAFPEILKVIGNSDTAYGLPNPNGQFMIRGIKDGTYSLVIHSLRKDSLGIAVNPYKDSTINNIIIKNANTVSVGNIVLHN